MDWIWILLDISSGSDGWGQGKQEEPEPDLKIQEEKSCVKVMIGAVKKWAIYLPPPTPIF
jgi:hypothetical protein